MTDDQLITGSKGWYVEFPFAILCEVISVDMQHKNRDEEGIIFYQLDEPIGYFVSSDELVETKEDAKSKLIVNALYSANQKLERYKELLLIKTLEDWRVRRIAYFFSKSSDTMNFSYREKKRGVEWFHINDL